MNLLPEVSDKLAICYEYFPTTWQAVVWRNWGYVPPCRIARALQTSIASLKQAAEQMGLNPEEPTNEIWLQRGYITIIRNNWHLCSYEQLLILLDMTEEMLAFTLKEDDFLWIKLGSLKPAVVPPKYSPLSKQQAEETEKIVSLLKNTFKSGDALKENGFEFLREFYLPMECGDSFNRLYQNTQGIRMVYPYFALYGDILMDDSTDYLPDRLLAEYAKCGVNGIWMQGILYQLVEFPFDASLSKGWEIRIKTLRKLVQKAKKYGIGIYLYLNEPRSMPEKFFNKHPDFKGAQWGDFFALCTSKDEVKDYLYKGVKKLFESVPDLAGYFSISMSENLTNCYSRTEGEPTECHRCAKRSPYEIVAEVNNLMAKGAHEAVPSAKAIVWTWGWLDEWVNKAIELLCEGQIVQCNSEQGVVYRKGGIEGMVSDYSMSVLGPGEYAKAAWKTARNQKMEVSAKVQVNTTWEIAPVPYIPVFDLIEEHIIRLKKQGVRHLQVSWTLGGYPSPNLRLVAWIMEGKGTVKEFLIDWLGNEAGEKVYIAQKQLSTAFSNFPFDMDVLYFSPHNYGPMAPFFLNKTGYEASMVGYPYDDLEKWAAIYPVEVYRQQILLLCEEWQKGVDMLYKCRCDSEDAYEIYLMAESILCHFKSALHHIQFISAREKGRINDLLKIIHLESDNVQTLINLRIKDSRIGYESSNHYFYTLQDLKEKIINLAYCERQLLNKQTNISES